MTRCRNDKLEKRLLSRDMMRLFISLSLSLSTRGFLSCCRSHLPTPADVMLGSEAS